MVWHGCYTSCCDTEYLTECWCVVQVNVSSLYTWPCCHVLRALLLFVQLMLLFIYCAEWSGGCVMLRSWERLGIDDIILILQQIRLWWYGHVLRKEDNDWVQKCKEYEVEGSRPRGRPKRMWREVVQKDCQARNLTEDAMDRSRWKKLIKIGWWSGWWVGECFFWYRLTRLVPDKGHKMMVVFYYCAAIAVSTQSILVSMWDWVYVHVCAL